MATQKISVPDIGGAEGAEVIEIHVTVGDTIEENQDIVALETDKASMDVPSSKAGKVTAIKVKIGDKVSEGDLLLEIDAIGVDENQTNGPKASEISSSSPSEKNFQSALINRDSPMTKVS